MYKNLPLYYKNKAWALLKLLLGQERYELYRATRMIKYKPDLKNPKTFCEKIIHRKLYDWPKDAGRLSDKYAVREFIKEEIGEQYLTKLYYVGDNPKQIPYETLPDKFVMKTTHGSGGNFIIKDKGQINQKEIEDSLYKYFSEDFGYLTNEGWYSDIKPRIIVEELLENPDGQDVIDYKFFCFHGKCHYIQVDYDRFTNHSRIFYNPDWQVQPFTAIYSIGEAETKPKKMDDMVRLSEKLSKNYDFVRVDLYNINDRIVFGEMTFAPGAGWVVKSPCEYDDHLGTLWNLGK